MPVSYHHPLLVLDDKVSNTLCQAPTCYLGNRHLTFGMHLAFCIQPKTNSVQGMREGRQIYKHAGKQMIFSNLAHSMMCFNMNLYSELRFTLWLLGVYFFLCIGQCKGHRWGCFIYCQTDFIPGL